MVKIGYNNSAANIILLRKLSFLNPS